ncbi:MAG: alpha/beta hydrolase [Micrococcales bacterium]|nr:alpha/beta hydrolase [Micrococcales bacterium]
MGEECVPTDDGWPTAAQTRDFDWVRLPPDVHLSMFDAPSGALATAQWLPQSGSSGGPSVLALPGVTGSKEDFALVGPLLARAGYRVTAVDLAGQYQSHAAGPQPPGRYDLALHLADAEALLDAYGPAHVIGYSFAGEVAMQLLVRRRAQVRSLTLVSAPPVPGNALARVRIVGPLSRVVGARGAAGLMTWGVRWNLNRASAARYRLVSLRLHHTRRESVVDAMTAMMHVPDVEDQARASGVPVLVVVGRGDLWTSARHRAFAERMEAQIRVYETGHSPMETTPREMTADLLLFLAAADEAAA